jgi:hypothetical protein
MHDRSSHGLQVAGTTPAAAALRMVHIFYRRPLHPSSEPQRLQLAAEGESSEGWIPVGVAVAVDDTGVGHMCDIDADHRVDTVDAMLGPDALVEIDDPVLIDDAGAIDDALLDLEHDMSLLTPVEGLTPIAIDHE